METYNLFKKGIHDSLQIKQSLYYVINNYEISKKTLLCMIVNGFFYFGSVVLYNFFLSHIFDTIEPSSTNWLILIVKFIMSILYNIWILVIYIVALTLNTFWVQDIFDAVLEINLINKF